MLGVEPTVSCSIEEKKSFPCCGENETSPDQPVRQLLLITQKAIVCTCVMEDRFAAFHAANPQIQQCLCGKFHWMESFIDNDMAETPGILSFHRKKHI